MQQHQPELTADDLTTITSSGFTAVVDAYAREEKQQTIWFLSMLGNQTSLKAIAASLLKQPPSQVHIVEEDPLDPGKDEYLLCQVPSSTMGTWTHKIVKLPNTKAFHSLVYTKKAEYNHKSVDFLLLPRTKEEAPTLHHMFLDRRVNLPLHESWAPWLWRRGIHNKTIIPIQSKGILAYICTPNPGQIRDELTLAITGGVLSLPSEEFPIAWPAGSNNVPSETAVDPTDLSGLQADPKSLVPALTT